MDFVQHRIWGKAEPHGRDPSAASSESGDDGETLPVDLRQHLAYNVHYLPEDSSSERVELRLDSDDKGQAPVVEPRTFADEGAHENGTCVPCHFHLTTKGCVKGTACAFCHYSHQRGPTRPCKKKRERCKKTLDMIEQRCDPEQFRETAQELCSQSTYMSTVVRGKLRQQHKELEHPGSIPVPPKQLITL
uniref:C3H1-type domain-containing protein n=1 Tax=Noctiluca scintillans TaxID=2966 RepID=A0A7S1AIL7_NOCSC|mmetsp:Transcript_47874/g.126741  ORF Transcript_47874/g.126741 Transcript_47874/m.126741 type:complete len:190 (+) Transcript_47874:63-632(+)